MIIATSVDRARTLTEEFTKGMIRKEYIARVKGHFPMYVLAVFSHSCRLSDGCSALGFATHVMLPVMRLRCSGQVRCDQPLLTVDRQMGLNIVHPEGKVRLHLHSLIPQALRIHHLYSYIRK
jgi:hypothetical protein